MNASFEEKSTWVQLIASLLIMGGYLFAANEMLAAGVHELKAFVPMFIVAVVLLVILLIAGHILATIGGAERADERDRLIGWRAEARSSTLLGMGVLAAITAMVLDVPDAYVAHGLLTALFLSDQLGYVLRLVDYRRGV